MTPLLRRFLTRLWHILVNKLDVILAGLLIFLFLLFLAVMFLEIIETRIVQLLGVSQKSEALKFLGIGMGGILLALQALASHKRAKAMEEAANAQAEATKQQAAANQNVERGQRQERLKNAIEHLGHQSDSVRLGGDYELFHLAQDTEDLRQTVMDILCAHIRRTTGEEQYREKHKSKPSEEVQSLLTLLFVQEHDVFKGFRINLQGSWLNGASLVGARLEGAILTRAYLQGAELALARFQGAELSRAHFQGAELSLAEFQMAELIGVEFQGAELGLTNFQGAELARAQFQGTYLFGAQFQGADLAEAQFQGVISQEEAVFPIKAFIGEDFLPFEERVRYGIGQDNDLSQVTFEGGLSQEDLDSLVEGLNDKKAKQLRETLMSHVGKPASDQQLEGSDAITGAYSEEEAERWIADYKKATS